MLVKNPLQRLAKYASIKASKYFSDFNFENLGAFNYTPPYFPEINGNLDKNAKLVTFSYYIKNTLQEMKLPDDYKPTKNEEKENKNWFKMF